MIRLPAQRPEKTDEPPVVILGGGASGVEMAATLADLLPTWYVPLGGDPQELRIVILQRGAAILKEFASDRSQPQGADGWESPDSCNC